MFSNFNKSPTVIFLTSTDHVLIKSVTELFDKLYDRRMRLRMIGISFKGLVRGTYQIDLFEDTVEMLSMYEALDKMKKRFGFDAVGRTDSILKNNL